MHKAFRVANRPANARQNVHRHAKICTERKIKPNRIAKGHTYHRVGCRQVRIYAVPEADTSIVAELNDKFGIGGYVTFGNGEGGLPTCELSHVCGSKCTIYLYGANITSWKQPSSDEVLYVRPDAKFDKTKAISGGIPICFPQFGPGEMRQHGFARDSDWTVASTSADNNPDDRDPSIELVLEDSVETRKEFPYSFQVVYTITLHRDVLQTDFRVINKGSEDFDITAALHSYFEVAGVEKARITGLQGLNYLDKVEDANNPTPKSESRDAVTVSGPVDSVYRHAPSELIVGVGTGAGIQIQNVGWPDAVVWNPWEAMPDFYKEFICVENCAYQKIKIPANGSWRARSDFCVIDL